MRNLKHYKKGSRFKPALNTPAWTGMDFREAAGKGKNETEDEVNIGGDRNNESAKRYIYLLRTTLPR